MKINTLIVAAVFASTTLSSCVFKTAEERHLKFTHTSIADGDAYAFFRQVGTIAPYEISYAKHVATVGNAQAKDAAQKVSQFFDKILPEMNDLATKMHVDFPILGTEGYVATEGLNHVTSNVIPSVGNDSTIIVEHANSEMSNHGSTYSDEAYLHHVQHQITLVKEQIRRLSRNTNKDLRDFGQSQTKAVAELFTAIGGKEDAHAHH